MSTPAPSRTPLTTYLVIASCVATFFLLQARDPQATIGAALWPLGHGFEPWQLFSHAFLHGNLTHLLFNMLGLFVFGAPIERAVGARAFTVLYFVSVLTAAITQLAFNAWTGTDIPSVGASGGLFGLMLMFALLFPRAKMILLILPIPIPAPLFVTLYAAAELWMGVTGTQQGVGHFAHLGGLLGGGLVWLYWRAGYERSKRRD